MPLYAKAAYNGNQLLNNGHKQIVAYFGITNESIASYNDYSSKLLGHSKFLFDYHHH